LDAFDIIDGLDRVLRDPYDVRLSGNRPADRLFDPVCCVGGKFSFPMVVKLFHGAQQPDISLLDQLQNIQPQSAVIFSQIGHETQIRLEQKAPCQFTLGLELL
jgi:hypothetical protein